MNKLDFLKRNIAHKRIYLTNYKLQLLTLTTNHDNPPAKDTAIVFNPQKV
jgi:hypothetical protein